MPASGTLRLRVALKCVALLDHGLHSPQMDAVLVALEQLRRATMYGDARDMLGDIRTAYWFDTVVRAARRTIAPLCECISSLYVFDCV